MISCQDKDGCINEIIVGRKSPPVFGAVILDSTSILWGLSGKEVDGVIQETGNCQGKKMTNSLMTLPSLK